MPIVAAFILFDFVVHNPGHPETRRNLAFLDIPAGYFTRLELVCTSRDGLPGVNLAEFSMIVRQYIIDQEKKGVAPSDFANGERSASMDW
jgi:hypothetical protein